jgi:predicted amidophosphoribosyltransferase
VECFSENCLKSVVQSNPEALSAISPLEGKTTCMFGFRPTQLIGIYEYYGKVRDCIKKSKYYSRQFMALKTLSREALGLSYEWAGSFDGFVCVPIPLSKEKYLNRGFNQALLIAHTLVKGHKLTLDGSILMRIIGTKAQHAINRIERFKNVSGCFSTGPGKLKEGRSAG